MVFPFPGANHFFGCGKKKKLKRNLHSWSSSWQQRVVKSFGPDSPVLMYRCFSLDSDGVICGVSLDAALGIGVTLIPQALMLLCNSAPMLSPAGYYSLGGAASFPLLKSEALQIAGFKAKFCKEEKPHLRTHMLAHMHAGNKCFHTWMDNSQSPACPKRFLTSHSRGTGWRRVSFLFG